jgi:tetratricopeptide (TPR) repeat protein
MKLLMKTKRYILLTLIVVGMFVGPQRGLSEENIAGKVINAQGSVEIFSSPTGWQPAKPGRALYPGEMVRTGSDGKAAILFTDETLARLNRNSRLLIQEVAPQAWWAKVPAVRQAVSASIRSFYRLERGQLWFRNKNRDIDIQIETPMIALGVRGTEADLRVQEDGSANLIVLEGVVQARNSLSALDVRAGEEVIARPGEKLMKQVILSPRDAVQWTISLPPLLDDPAGLPPSLQEAHQKIIQGSMTQAKTLLLNAAAAGPGDYRLYNLLALTSLLMDDKKDALAYAKKAADANPGVVTSWLILSYAHQAAFDLEQARQAAKQALSVDAHHIHALVTLARLNFSMDDTEGASALIREALRLAPANGEALNLKGFIDLAQGDQEGAATCFLSAIRQDPSLGEPHMGLGLAFMRNGEVSRAMEEITTAVLLEPQRSLFLTYWGKILYQIRRFDKALDVLTVAAELDPHDPTPLFYRALILRDLNRPGEAITSLNQAISLNDQRAVYRSRFLLDRDLATRNIDLSRLFSQLGLNAWARNKAMAATKQDYANANAHIFLAGSLQDSGDRSWAFAGESLLARLLQPANVNTFNNFNEYTSFFEKPSINATVSGTVGNEQFRGGSLLVYGSAPDLHLALAGGAFYSESDGWNDTNGERIGNGALYGKWDATPRDGWMAVVSGQKSKTFGASYPRFEWDSVRKPDDWSESKVERFEAGYHRHFSPWSDLLIHFSRVDGTTDIYNKSLFSQAVNLPPPAIVRGNSLFTVTNLLPYYQAQGQYFHKLGAHQVRGGAVFYWGDNNLKGKASTEIKEIEISGVVTPVSIPPQDSSFNNQTGRRLQSYYLQDTWKPLSFLTVEGALYFDRMENGDPFSNTAWTRNDWNPRLGLIITPTTQDTIRLAAFRYRLPFLSSRMDPMDIAGIPVFRNSLEGSAIEEATVALEREWSSGFTSLSLFTLDQIDDGLVRGSNGNTEKNQIGRQKGIDLSFNQLLRKNLGFSAAYNYRDIKDDALPQVDREDHILSGLLTYVHPMGITAGVRQSYRHERFKNTERTDEVIWITDLSFQYELPEKKGAIQLDINNLFDQRFNWVTGYYDLTGRIPVRESRLTLSINF